MHLIENYLHEKVFLSPKSRSKLKRRFKNPEFIGQGVFATAFAVSDHHVVKFTTDKTEILTARMLMKRPLDCCVRVYYARFLQAVDGVPVWQIITERVTPIGENYDILHEYDTAYCEYYNDGYRWDKKNYWLNKSILFLREIEDNGLCCSDLHGGNVGVRNGTDELVALDLGLMNYD